MEKTVREWFESIKDEDVRKRALLNMRTGDLKCHTLASAIFYGFVWDCTTEDVVYWNEQYQKALNNEL